MPRAKKSIGQKDRRRRKIVIPRAAAGAGLCPAAKTWLKVRNIIHINGIGFSEYWQIRSKISAWEKVFVFFLTYDHQH